MAESWQPWEISWDDEAVRNLERLDRRTRERILRAVERFATTGHGDIARLRGEDREFRLRVGQWRVRFVFQHPSHSIYILHVFPRGRA